MKQVLFAALLLSFTSCFSPHRPPNLAVPGRENPSGVFALPVHPCQILSRFGGRGRRFHTGLDVRGRRGGGDLALASRDGKVTDAKVWHGYGRMVTVKHSDGFVTRYAHLKKFLVKPGQKVKTGDALGVIGRSGRASTEHLHFEILTPTGRFADPEPYLFKK